jgi:diacylglycerol kinase (ATP)
MTEEKNRQWAFIINPIAGNGFAKTIVPTLEKMIRKNNINAELSARFLERGFSYIVGVGGDGTINEISRPLINKENVAIGVIPAGTGNDFIQILGFPNRFGEKEWNEFFNANVIKMDVGSCNGMIFLNGMGLGFDAQVAAENYVEPGEVKRGGKHKYIWHIIKTLLFFREKRMTVITGDELLDTDCFINTIAIGRRFAGGFMLTPKAIANDGLLDVCMIKKLSLFQRFDLLLKVPKGEHIADKKVHYYQTPGISLGFSEKVPFHVDGELNFSKKFDVSILPSSLNTIYNPDGDHFFKRQ